jgi:hypothetical protein
MALETRTSAGGEPDEGGLLAEKAGDVNRAANQVRWARNGIVGDRHIEIRTVVLDPEKYSGVGRAIEHAILPITSAPSDSAPSGVPWKL